MEIGSMAPDSCTGDGILMAEAVGAALYENPWVIGFNTSPFPGAPSQLSLFSAATPTLLYVDPSGKRVMNESQHYAIVTGHAIRAGGVLYAIFDSNDYHNPAQSSTTAASRIEAAITADATIVGKYVFKSTISVADLGSQIFHASVQSDFTTQISDYNGFVAAPTSPGDTEFGKDAAYLVNSIDTGPFYAVKVRPHIMGTFGGVKTIVETGEVLDTTNRVIPGLYAAGENANRVFFNQVYMSGGALLVASSTGKAAGAAAARYSK
jgi:fumarate reductase flavoprotein subunit